LNGSQHLQARGPGAIDWLLEQAELAYAQGDAETAGMWREIAEAAVLIVQSHPGH
jgi:hypothetical protein